MIGDVVSTLYENKDSEKAVKMAAYMKNQFSFLGIQKPKRHLLTKEFIKHQKRQKTVDWQTVDMLWNLPEREFQYFAIDYLAALKDYIKSDDAGRIEKIITTKSWWDTVDIIASVIVGEICRNYPHIVQTHVIPWSESSNIWLVRTAILYQLKYKEDTDTKLLSEIIKKNTNEKEFFIAKAIGWILREYSKTNKEWVKHFIEANTLQPLSVREGSKYI